MGASLSQQGERGAGTTSGTPHRFTYTPDTEQSHIIHRSDKKKKTSKFATLKKKLIKKSRQSRSYDHTKSFRDLLSSWSIRDVHTLVEQYEASLALKELTLQASLARPHGNTFREDLSLLYDHKYFTDVDLIYQGTVFPVHRAILSVRCPYFRDLLARYPEHGARIQVNIRTPGVDVTMFSMLLRYLYTGEFPQPQDTVNKNLNLLIRLADEFGTPNALENDLRTLLETGMYADALLTFSTVTDNDTLFDHHHNNSADNVHHHHHNHHHHHHHHHNDSSRSSTSSNSSSTTTATTHRRHELRCHKAILAARSPFFRNLLLRRQREAANTTQPPTHLHAPTCIQLDESVIPRRYARVLLHTLYLDSVDLSCIVRSQSVSMCSLSEVQAMVAGAKTSITVIDEAMEIYQIGQFLEFPILSHGCESVIVEHTTAENIVSVLQWSGEAHGSAWVHRQALQILRDDFHQVAHCSVLHDLGKQHLIHAIQSLFLQASELEVLVAVLKWGEHQLIKRLEEREPNLLSHTTHSISKKGIKKRDLNDIELREILADLLPYVRMDHVVPRNHDVVTNAIKRGLVSVPPSHMLGDEGNQSASSAWVRGKNCGVYITPRAFIPYYEEAKNLVEENLQHCGDSDNVRLRTVHISTGIPDTLYMVDQQMYHGGVGGGHVTASSSSPSLFPPVAVDMIAGTIPVPSDETIRLMMKREAELKQTKTVQRALALACCERRNVVQQVQLRVVREFGLPDSSVEVLRTSPNSTMNEHLLDEARYHTPKRKKPRECMSRDHPHYPTMSTPNSPVRSYSPDGMEVSTCSDSALCEMMPDIALATASINQMSLHDYHHQQGLGLDDVGNPPGISHHHHHQGGAGVGISHGFPPAALELQLDLDLGDGTSHHSGSRASTFDRQSHGGTLYI